MFCDTRCSSPMLKIIAYVNHTAYERSENDSDELTKAMLNCKTLFIVSFAKTKQNYFHSTKNTQAHIHFTLILMAMTDLLMFIYLHLHFRYLI